MSFNLSCYVGQLTTSGALGHDVDLVVGGGQPLCAQLLEGEGGLAGDYSEFGIFTFDCLLISILVRTGNYFHLSWFVDIDIYCSQVQEGGLAGNYSELGILALDCLFLLILVRTGNYFHP